MQEAHDELRVRDGEGALEPDFVDAVETALVEAPAPAFGAGTSSELEEHVRDLILEALPNDRVAEAVRELATRDLGAANARRLISREVLVGLLNGLLFAAIMGSIVFFSLDSGELGLIIAAAMIINMLVAGFFGILIPLGLDAMSIDPAVASSVLVTTVTGVVGVFAFLGLAALWLGWIALE